MLMFFLSYHHYHYKLTRIRHVNRTFEIEFMFVHFVGRHATQRHQLLTELCVPGAHQVPQKGLCDGRQPGRYGEVLPIIAELPWITFKTLNLKDFLAK